MTEIPLVPGEVFNSFSYIFRTYSVITDKDWRLAVKGHFSHTMSFASIGAPE